MKTYFKLMKMADNSTGIGFFTRRNRNLTVSPIKSYLTFFFYFVNYCFIIMLERELKPNYKNVDLSNLNPKWNCPKCGDWFHMPYKYCKCPKEYHENNKLLP